MALAVVAFLAATSWLAMPRAPAQEPGITSDRFSVHEWEMDDAALRGRRVYEDWCIGCHGEEGRGDGEAAEFLNPKPRNFHSGAFKFRSTPTGAPPTRQDLYRTITCGLIGSAMPGFPLVSQEERWDVVEYVHALMAFGMAEREVRYLVEEEEMSLDEIRRESLQQIRDEVLARIEETAQPVIVPPQPAATPESIERGRVLFEKGCTQCHGATGQGDGFSSYTMRDWKDSDIPPRDFTTGVFRSGSTATDMFIRLKTGLNGTPMPPSGDSDEDRWAFVHYMMSLRDPDRPPPKHIRRGCGAPELDR